MRRVPLRVEVELGSVVEGEDSDAVLALPTLGLTTRDFRATGALSDRREGDFFDSRLEDAFGGE